MQYLESQYAAIGNTDCLFSGYKMHEGRILPRGREMTPDSAISDKSGLPLVVEVATSQTRKAVGRKLKTFFKNPSVITGTIVNIDKTEPYASLDDANDWDSDKEFVGADRAMLGVMPGSRLCSRIIVGEGV
jgi:hypothetical protein